MYVSLIHSAHTKDKVRISQWNLIMENEAKWSKKGFNWMGVKGPEESLPSSLLHPWGGLLGPQRADFHIPNGIFIPI